MRTITILQNDAGQRLDKFLLKLMPDMPKSLLYKLIRKKDIKYNGARCKGMELLQCGDVLTLYVKEEFFRSGTKSLPSAASGKINPVYEDDDILIVYKPAGMFAHSGNAKNAVVLVDEVQKYLMNKGDIPILAGRAIDCVIDAGQVDFAAIGKILGAILL
ncbi:MAG: hypothetical protein II341_02780, partial [Oscillospiraceae bacterium]|nr:hypothetical protein [Oscillospiraceae bacterium]